VPNTPAALDFVQKLLEHSDYLQKRLWESAVVQCHYASRHTKPYLFTVADNVWLFTKNLATARPSKMLDKKFVGPFVVKEQISSQAYRLELPKTIKRLHDIFHVSLLEPNQSNGRLEYDSPPNLQVECEEEYKVEEILHSNRI
jgi:hypothetical protein